MNKDQYIRTLDCFLELRAALLEGGRDCGTLDALFGAFIESPGLPTWNRLTGFWVGDNDRIDDLTEWLFDAAFKLANL